MAECFGRDGKPSGTFTPLLVSSRTISPSEAFLPPTSGMSSIVMSANHLMKGCA
jgi:hypothetical protein